MQIAVWILESVFLLQLPNKQESISDVFVGSSLKWVDYSMNNLSNLIDKEHDTFLQDFSGICEVPDIAEAKDGHAFDSGKHGIDLVANGHVLGNDLWASFSEA